MALAWLDADWASALSPVCCTSPSRAGRCVLILFVCRATSASTESEAPSGALKIETLAAAPPIIEVEDELRARLVRHYGYAPSGSLRRVSTL